MMQLIRGALTTGVLSLSLGCVAVVPYTPDTTQVEKLGKENASVRLRELLSRATAPRVASIDVTDEFVRMIWQETVPGPFWVPHTYSNESQIYFANISRFEVYENNYVYVWGPQDSRVDKVLFANQEDARAFVDLLASFRAARMAR